MLHNIMKASRKKSYIKAMFMILFSIVIMTGSVSARKTIKVVVDDIELADVNSNQDSEHENPEIYQASFEAIFSFMQFDLHFDSYLIRELIQVTEITYSTYIIQPDSQITFFKTLFSRIISPNAP